MHIRILVDVSGDRFGRRVLVMEQADTRKGGGLVDVPDNDELTGIHADEYRANRQATPTATGATGSRCNLMVLVRMATVGRANSSRVIGKENV